MKKYIYLLLLLYIAAACSSSTSTHTDSSAKGNIPNITDEISNDITISDGTHSRMLTFGIHDQATDSLDQVLDIESPPFNPSGTFFAHFLTPDHKLFKDIKSSKITKAHWPLAFSGEGKRDIELSWDWDSKAGELEGAITLQDRLKDPKVVVNMLTENSYAAQTDSINGKLFIVYHNNK
ncbi:MAG TPA: hypothetical protein VK084_00790 [Chitinophagaceae bacterium]|nr:hypothetical protein [Chitinophagaceae bacterium]